MKIQHSEECSKSELDLFTVPPTQIAVESGVWDNIKPHQNFNYDAVNFDVQGDSLHYIDLSQTELWIKLQLVLREGPTDKTKLSDLKLSSGSGNNTTYRKLVLVNNLLHSIFSQVQVSLNNKEVENTNGNYAYKAYLNNLLSYDQESKETFLQNEMFYKDTPGKLDSDTENLASLARLKRFIESDNNVQLRGKLHCDIFNTNRYLLSNVNMQVKLSRNKPNFYLFGSESDNYLIRIQETFLRIRRVKISPSIMLNHAMALEKTTAKYPIKRVLMKNILLPYSATKLTLTNIHAGILPTRVVVGFVNNTAYDGAKDRNPFNFDHFNMQKLTLKCSSAAMPYSSGIEMDFKSTKSYLEGYNTLFQNISQTPNNISYDDYAKGFTIYAFDLSPDLCNSDHYSIFKDGVLDLEIDKDSTDAQTPITALFYLEFDNIIEITKQRNVLVDYQV